MYKKILSVIISLAMVLPMVLQCGASIEDWGYEEWPDGEVGGNQYVEAPYFEEAPTIDGIISEAEWGKYTVRMWSNDSATVDDKMPYYASFFYWKGAENGKSCEDEYYEYDLWLRWTEDSFYVGVKVRDYDGHSQNNSGSDAWNGDAIEFRVDPEGANVSGDLATPWSDHYSIPYIVAAYSELGGGFFECYDNAAFSSKGLTAYSDPKWGAVDIAVAPAGSNYSDDTLAGFTTYELAIPWKYIFENENYNSSTDDTPVTLTRTEWSPQNLYGAYGKELGMSLMVINAPEGSSSYSSMLEWGSGLISVQEWYVPQTLSGSNGVVLTDATVTPQAGYPTADPSVLEKANETQFAGEDVFYDYLAGDFDKTNPLTSVDELSSLTYENVIDPDAQIKVSTDQQYWGDFEYFMGSVKDEGGEHGYVLNYDRAISDYFDGENQFTAGVSPIPQYYVHTGNADRDYLFPDSYTIEFDIRYLGTEMSVDGREPQLMNWFGGASQVSYEMGYSFNDAAFVARERGTWDLTNKHDYMLVPCQWYNWKFQFDNSSGTARLYIDGELILEEQNRNFIYPDMYAESGVLLCYWFINTQVQFDNVKIYNLYDYGEGVKDDEPEYKAGDINLDGSINITDMFNLKMVLTGQANFSEDVMNAADINRDGSINVTDLFRLKNILINS